MMSNEKLHNNQIGLRIRTARKEKGINQTELAIESVLLEKKKVSTKQSLQIC